jgi:hypothetical protein
LQFAVAISPHGGQDGRIFFVTSNNPPGKNCLVDEILHQQQAMLRDRKGECQIANPLKILQLPPTSASDIREISLDHRGELIGPSA